MFDSTDCPLLTISLNLSIEKFIKHFARIGSKEKSWYSSWSSKEFLQNYYALLNCWRKNVMLQYISEFYYMKTFQFPRNLVEEKKLWCLFCSFEIKSISIDGKACQFHQIRAAYQRNGSLFWIMIIYFVINAHPSHQELGFLICHRIIDFHYHSCQRNFDCFLIKCPQIFSWNYWHKLHIHMHPFSVSSVSFIFSKAFLQIMIWRLFRRSGSKNPTTVNP